MSVHDEYAALMLKFGWTIDDLRRTNNDVLVKPGSTYTEADVARANDLATNHRAEILASMLYEL